MLAETFIKKLEENAPSLEDLKKIGLNEKEAEKFISKYFGTEKSFYQNVYRDELLRLVNNYDLKNVEVRMISFYEKIEQDIKFFYIGKAEVDLLVVNKSTGEVQIYEFDSSDHLLWDCAANGAKFLDAIMHSVPFSIKCIFDDDLWNNNKVILEIALECAEIAGGDKYADFFKVYLGCFE